MTENSVSRVTPSFKAKISDPFEQPTSKVEYFELLTINDLCLLVPVIIYPLHISGCCIYSYTVFCLQNLQESDTYWRSKQFRTDINYNFASKMHNALIVNKMLVAFAFRSLTVFYMLSCINNIKLKRQKLNQTNTLLYLATISAPPYTLYDYL